MSRSLPAFWREVESRAAPEAEAYLRERGWTLRTGIKGTWSATRDNPARLVTRPTLAQLLATVEKQAGTKAPRPCEECGTLFVPVRPRTVSCSPRCVDGRRLRKQREYERATHVALPKRKARTDDERHARVRRLREAIVDGVLPEDLAARFGEGWRALSRTRLPGER